METDYVRAGVGVLELKKNGLRGALEQFRESSSSLLLLSLQWKDLEDHYEAMHETIERRSDELKVREESIENGLRDLELKKRRFEESIGERVRMIEAKRKDFDLLWEKMDAKFRLAIEGARRGVDETVDEVESVKGEIVSRFEEISGKEQEFESASGSVVGRIKERFKKIEAKEKELNSKEEEIERTKKKVFAGLVGFKMGMEKLDEGFKGLALREKQLDERVREFELKNVEFEADREKLDEFSRQLEAKDVQVAERLKEIESRNKDIEEKGKQLESIKERFEAEWRKLEGVSGKEDRFEPVNGSVMEWIKEMFKQIDAKQKELNLREAEVERRNKVVGENHHVRFKMDMEKLGEGFQALVSREKEFEERVREFELKNVEFEAERGKLEEVSRQMEVKNVQIKERLKEIESKNKDVEEQREGLEWSKKRYEADKKKLDDRIRILNHEDRQVNGRSKVIESRTKDLERQHKEFESKKRKFEADNSKLDEQMREVGFNAKNSIDKAKELESRSKELEGQCRKLEMDKRKLEVDRKRLDEQLRDLEVKGKQCEDKITEIESSKKELETRLEQLKAREKCLEARNNEIELQGKKSEELSKEIQGANNSPCILVNGPTLQIILNECWKDDKIMGFWVSFLLRLSLDPAKLVLDAVKSFFPPYLKVGGVEFAGSVVRRSCILLLEQLMKISPNVNPVVKTEARRLSFDWITKVKPDTEHAKEILAFLLLLAAYDLGSTFDLDELFNYVKVVAHFRQVTSICRRLGMTGKVQGLIQDLIDRKKRIVGIRYAFEFNLVKQFPLDLLLKDHIEKSKIIFTTTIERGNHSLKAQAHAMDKRIIDLKEAIKSIENYNITSGYSIADLRLEIASLEKNKAGRRKGATICDIGSKVVELNGEDHKLHTSPNTASPVPSIMSVESNTATCAVVEIVVNPSPETPLPNLIGSNYPHTTPPCEASPNGVDCSSSVQSVEINYHHQADLSTQDPLLETRDNSGDKDTSPEVCVKLEGENSEEQKVEKILRALPYPAKFVFFAMKSFVRSNTMGAVPEMPISWLLLLLKEFKKVSECDIEPETITEAKKLAATWKTTMVSKNYQDLVEVMCFVLFLDAYNLATNFSAGEVISLMMDTKQLCSHFEQIGMPEFLPDFVQKLIDTNSRIKAIRYIHALDLSERFPIALVLDEHLQYWKERAEEICKGPNSPHPLQNTAINKRLAAIRSAIKLIKDCKLEPVYPIKGLEETVAELMLQRTKKQPQNPPSEQNPNKPSSELVVSSTTTDNSEAANQLSGQKRPVASINTAMSSFPPSTPTPSNLKNQGKESWGNKKRPKWTSPNGKFRGRGGRSFGRGNAGGFHEPTGFDGRFGGYSEGPNQNRLCGVYRGGYRGR